MKINLKYTVAINILIVCNICKDKKITANYINSIMGCDVTTIRQIMFDLKKAGFIEGKPGPGGTKLVKDLNDISLFDVYIAVLDPQESMLKFYNTDTDNNTLSKAIQFVVDNQFNEYRDMLLFEMQKTTVGSLCQNIESKLTEKISP